MKNLKTIILGVALISSTALMAQNDATKVRVSEDFKAQSSLSTKDSKQVNSPELIAKKQTNKMVKLLGLSAEQKTKVGELNLKVQNKLAVVNNSRMNEKQKKQQIEGNQKDRMRVLSTILTTEQYDKYAATQK